MNNNGAPTCIHQERPTVNDYTLSRNVTISSRVVLDDVSLSDHLYISFTVSEAAAQGEDHYAVLDTEKLRRQLSEIAVQPPEIKDKGSGIEATNWVKNLRIYPGCRKLNDQNEISLKDTPEDRTPGGNGGGDQETRS